MPRLLGVDIPKEKKLKISLHYIYGIGPHNAMDILAHTGIDSEKRAAQLTEDEISRIAAYVQSHYKVEGELRREMQQNIRRLVEIGCYRGLRHKKGLPVRGQRTRCNARTRKGPRPRVGGVKRKEGEA
jgi:small subunit ribosomal protein S13